MNIITGQSSIDRIDDIASIIPKTTSSSDAYFSREIIVGVIGGIGIISVLDFQILDDLG
jgi:hypothetical protein